MSPHPWIKYSLYASSLIFYYKFYHFTSPPDDKIHHKVDWIAPQILKHCLRVRPHLSGFRGNSRRTNPTINLPSLRFSLPWRWSLLWCAPSPASPSSLGGRAKDDWPHRESGRPETCHQEQMSILSRVRNSNLGLCFYLRQQVYMLQFSRS